MIAATAAAVAAEAAATLGVSLNGRGEGEEKEILPGVTIYYESRADGMKKSIGPVYFAAFKELVDTRVIHIHTRVWRKPPGGEVCLHPPPVSGLSVSGFVLSPAMWCLVPL